MKLLRSEQISILIWVFLMGTLIAKILSGGGFIAGVVVAVAVVLAVVIQGQGEYSKKESNHVHVGVDLRIGKYKKAFVSSEITMMEIVGAGEISKESELIKRRFDRMAAEFGQQLYRNKAFKMIRRDNPDGSIQLSLVHEYFEVEKG